MDTNLFNSTVLGGIVRGTPTQEQYQGRPHWSFMLEHRRQNQTGSMSILVDVWFDRLFPLVAKLVDGSPVVVFADLRSMGGGQNRRPSFKLSANNLIIETALPSPRTMLDTAIHLPEATHSSADEGGPF